MKYYYVDREGWWDWDNSIKGIEGSLELFDIANEEYLIVDSMGYLYDYEESDEGYYGYTLNRSGRFDLSLTVIFEKQIEGKKMDKSDLMMLSKHVTKDNSK